MNRATDGFELNWCFDHLRWYVGDCPSCMVRNLEDKYEPKLEKLQDKIDDLRDELDEVIHRGG